MRFLVLFLFLCSGARPAVAEDKLNIDYDCHGNALEACYLILEGQIDTGAAERLDAFLQNGLETFQVLLNSKGGDLDTGIAIGRIVRKFELQTRIGIYQDQDFPAPGECLSACAYAFLGGTRRVIQEGSRIGFHQFAIQSNIPTLEGVGGLIIGQKLSANIIAYIVEMGVDARLFAIASETSFGGMYFPEQAERLEYDVETAAGFSNFSMEPYGNGVVAASQRLGPTHAYDRVDHLTAFCRGGRAHVLLTMHGKDQFVPDPAIATSSVSITDKERPAWNEWTTVEVDQTNVRAWTGPKGAYIEINFNAQKLPFSDRTKWFHTSLFASRAAGGNYSARVALNEMDRNMLRTAFRLCI